MARVLLNLGISDEAHDNNDGQEPLQFTQVMDTLRPSTDTGVRSKVVRLYELMSIEVRARATTMFPSMSSVSSSDR